jgi:hypothetical protein
LGGQLEHEICREAIGIALDRAGVHSVKRRQVGIEDYSLTAHQMDCMLDGIERLAGCAAPSWREVRCSR